MLFTYLATFREVTADNIWSMNDRRISKNDGLRFALKKLGALAPFLHRKPEECLGTEERSSCKTDFLL